MPRNNFTTLADVSDEAYQDGILPHVSRTFALTIPQLPAGLRSAVTSAYLLCRIADTIEDEPALSAAETHVYLERFAAVVAGREEAAPLAREVAARLSDRTLEAERDLVRNMDRVIRMTARMRPEQREAIGRCIDRMCYGMHYFQRTASLGGLVRSSDLDSYCYYVAGVVGEMLTELFCSYSSLTAERHAGLSELATLFAQGLQMTNILKDVWEDRSRGACWLPQDVFARHGVDLTRLEPAPFDARFGAALTDSSASRMRICATRSPSRCSFLAKNPASAGSACGPLASRCSRSGGSSAIPGSPRAPRSRCRTLPSRSRGSSPRSPSGTTVC